MTGSMTRVGLVPLCLLLLSCSDGITDPDELQHGRFEAELTGALEESLSGSAELTTAATTDDLVERSAVILRALDSDLNQRVVVLVFKSATAPGAGEYRSNPEISLEGPMEDDEVRVWLGEGADPGNLLFNRSGESGIVVIQEGEGFIGSFQVELTPSGGSDEVGSVQAEGEFRARCGDSAPPGCDG